MVGPISARECLGADGKLGPGGEGVHDLAALGIAGFSWLGVALAYIVMGATRGAKQYVVRVPNHRFEMYVLIAGQVVMTVLGGSHAGPAPLIASCAGAGGAAFCVVGLLLFVAARRELGENWDRHACIRHGHELVRSGPYALCRNPIFLAQLLLLLGLAVGTLSPWALLAVMLGLLSVRRRIGVEEIVLESYFAGAYRDYVSDVPRLLPRIPGTVTVPNTGPKAKVEAFQGRKAVCLSAPASAPVAGNDS